MSKGHILDFVKESGGKRDTARMIDDVLCRNLLPPCRDAFAEAHVLRRVLINQGFEYDDDIFCAQDLINHRAGNCLGYSLLIGGVLLDRGFPVSFQLITHPKDAVHDQDERLFGELYRGEHFTYDNPKLPRVRDVPKFRAYRFAPLEHPSLVIDGRAFEVTSLEDLDEDPSWIPGAELVRGVSFHELLSFVGIDRAQMLFDEEDLDLAHAKDLVVSSLRLWPQNREGWLVLWRIASDLNDESLKAEASRRYETIGGDDSRFFQGMYEVTGDPSFLTLSLERFPAGIMSFSQKCVKLEKDPREAKFNLAVAACCVLNSSVLDLKRFYLEHEETVKRLYGVPVWKTLFS